MANVSDDTKHRAFKLCKEFMGKSWKCLKYNDFKIDYMSGGLSNLLYLCEISNNKVETNSDEPRKVVLRIYGKIIQEHPEMMVTDSLIFGLLAEKGMGPKLYGVFSDGRVEQYIESRHLWTKELHLPNVSQECARVMSKFHKMTMPLVKKPRWLFDMMDRYTTDAEEILRALNKGVDNDKPNPQMLEKFNSFHITEELERLKHILKQVHSPVTFCHNDMQEGNILLFSDSEPIHIQAIDFEYSSYNFRGFDIGNHFCEWCYNYHQVDEFPYFAEKLEDYPTREQQLLFVRTYMAEMGITGSEGDTVNTEDHILLEANTYALASHFMWALWGIIQGKISTINFGYWEYALVRFDAYFQQKKQLVALHAFNYE